MSGEEVGATVIVQDVPDGPEFVELKTLADDGPEFVELKTLADDVAWVNPENVTLVMDQGGGATLIHLTGGRAVKVWGHPKDILELMGAVVVTEEEAE